jgi:hypothetical protein
VTYGQNSNYNKWNIFNGELQNYRKGAGDLSGGGVMGYNKEQRDAGKEKVTRCRLVELPGFRLGIVWVV